MTRLPTLRPTEVIRALGRAGFSVDRITGSHHILRHPDRPGRIVVAIHARDLKRGALAGTIKQAGLTREEFLEIL